MTPAFATAARCTHVFEAEILRGARADAGVAAWLADAETVTVDWMLSVVVGGVKVRVPWDSAGDARAVLAAPDPDLDFEPPTPAEVAARRALTAALIAFGWPPFMLLAGYNVGRVVATADGETARTWGRAAAAFVLVAASVAVVVILLGRL